MVSTPDSCTSDPEFKYGWSYFFNPLKKKKSFCSANIIENVQPFFSPLCLHLCLTHIIKNSFITSFPAEELTEAGILLVIDGVVIVFVVTFDGSRYFAWLLMGW